MFLLTLVCVAWILKGFATGGWRSYSGDYGQSRPMGSMGDVIMPVALLAVAWIINLTMIP
mgnify:CR=1 FL=1